MKLIEITELNVFYGDIQVLWSISMEISEGDFVSIIGANGAGKTTLLKTISGLVRPRSGFIKFKGSDIHTLPPSKLVEMGIVHIPERRRLFPDLKTLDNLELGAYTKKARKNKKENLKNIFSIFPILAERKNQDAGTLSGGEQQMLAIARGMMAMPKVLMLDEPSLGLAPLVTKEIFKIVNQINNNGITVILVDQNVKNVLTVANTGFVLESGKICNEGECRLLLEDKELKKAYLGM